MSFAPGPKLSQRGQSRLEVEIATPRYAISGKFYDKENNPSGAINLNTAENSLMTKELLEYMHGHFHLAPNHLKYRSSIVNGFVDSTIQALPMYINDYANPIIPVTPEHCVPGPGIGALIAQFIWAVCNEGEGVAMTTPFYDDYLRDIVYPGRAKVVAAHVPIDVDPLGLESIQYIEQAIMLSNSNGTRVRVLVLCNPHNPLANAYPVETITAYARLTEKFDLHLLVDEVYANQVFASSFVPNPTPFISILQMDIASVGCNPSRVHVLAGPTKDFGASGVKVGAFVSQHNPDIVKLVNAALRATPISSAADALFTPIINDLAFRTWFLEENRIRLRAAFEQVAKWCTFHKIPFVPASAGVFFLADFGPLLDNISPPEASLEQKMDIAIASMLENGVFMRPTTASGDPNPTRFRMVFTLPKETMTVR